MKVNGMAYHVNVERYINSKIKKNSLTEIVKYRLDKLADAVEFAKNISQIDGRVVSAELEEING